MEVLSQRVSLQHHKCDVPEIKTLPELVTIIQNDNIYLI